MKLASIHVYPVKGARGIALAASDVLRSGLRHDRRFMLVDANGAFMTQRRHPKLALVDVALGDEAITVGGAVRVSLDDAEHANLPRRSVTIWDDVVDAVAVPGEASTLFCDVLGEACTLLYFPRGTHERPSFADAYPVLVATLASLADLNARLATPVLMDRFRPNLVVEGGEPYEEERHPEIVVGAVRMRLPKRCSRCDVVMVDPRTAEVGKEPLRTLASYRKDGNHAYFAMNAIPECEGRVAVNDAVVYPQRPATP